MLGTIEAEIQFRGTPDAQTLHQFVADVFTRGFQPFQALIRIRVVAFNIDPHFRGTAIVGYVNRRDADQSDTGISQFTFHERFNLLAQSFPDSSAMMFESALLHELSP